jgi:RNA polymerase sigma-70 factor (ECF subfamily)
VKENPEPAQQSTPAELAARICAGDRAAEEELVARYGRGVSVILRHIGSTREAADDLYQEVFVLALVKIRRGELRDPERLSGFISSLARNLAIEYYRRHAPAKSHAPFEEATSAATPAPSPLHCVLRIEDALLVRRVLAEMPLERDRQVLYRFYIGEEDKERICLELNLTSLQFNRVLHRARERFRELFERATGRTAREGMG